MTSKQLINQLCYEYSTKNYNEEKLKTTQEIKKNLNLLEEYRKIEEELGIDFSILFKTLKNGFYYYYDNRIVHTSNNESYISLQAQSCLPNQMCIEVDYGDRTMCFYFEDYRKAWALTREELENE